MSDGAAGESMSGGRDAVRNAGARRGEPPEARVATGAGLTVTREQGARELPGSNRQAAPAPSPCSVLRALQRVRCLPSWSRQSWSLPNPEPMRAGVAV